MEPAAARRSVPDLKPAEPDDRAPLAEPRTARAMVRFTDGSLHLCWVRAWQRGPAWLVHLAWDVQGPPTSRPDCGRQRSRTS